jgi:hypothetical protein
LKKYIRKSIHLRLRISIIEKVFHMKVTKAQISLSSKLWTSQVNDPIAVIEFPAKLLV